MKAHHALAPASFLFILAFCHADPFSSPRTNSPPPARSGPFPAEFRVSQVNDSTRALFLKLYEKISGGPAAVQSGPAGSKVFRGKIVAVYDAGYLFLGDVGSPGYVVSSHLRSVGGGGTAVGADPTPASEVPGEVFIPRALAKEKLGIGDRWEGPVVRNGVFEIKRADGKILTAYQRWDPAAMTAAPAAGAKAAQERFIAELRAGRVFEVTLIEEVTCPDCGGRGSRLGDVTRGEKSSERYACPRCTEEVSNDPFAANAAITDGTGKITVRKAYRVIW